MTKVALALSTALLTMALGSGAAMATTLTGTTTGPLLPGVDDAFQILLNGNVTAGFPVLFTNEAACVETASIGGCSFSIDQFSLAGGVTIKPNLSVSNQLAQFTLPGTTTTDAIFAIGCETPVRNAGGLCTGTANFTILTPDAADPFNLSLLAGSGVTVAYTGTELAGGAATAFDLTNYINITGAGEGQTYTARLVLSNPVPEPLTLSLFGAGLIGAVTLRRRKRA